MNILNVNKDENFISNHNLSFQEGIGPLHLLKSITRFSFIIIIIKRVPVNIKSHPDVQLLLS